MNPTQLDRALRDTVQELPDAKKDNGATAAGFWSLDIAQRGPLLSAWGTRRRLWELRMYDRHNYNTLWQGAAAGLIKQFSSTPSQVKGGRNLTAYFDELLRYAQFGKGQRVLKALVARDYLRFDIGAFVEIIAPGNPLKKPTGRITGLAHLDSFHCFPTGDPEYPVLYYNTRPGKKPSLNMMHYTRVLNFVDMPDGDQDRPGTGLCALSRVIALCERQILMGKYIVTKLDDKPPPGMLLVSGMSRQAWDAAWARYSQDQNTDAHPEWGRVIPLFGADAELTPKVESVAFSTAPEAFDYKVYVELDVHELALGIGVGIQDLWELTSGNIGSKGQSEIQHVKSQGNTLGDMLSSWELGMNNFVLPASLEYIHKVPDPYSAQQDATTAQTWAGVATSVSAVIGNQLAAQMLANQVPAIADVLFDENGQMIRLPDQDKKPADEQQDNITAEDDAPNSSTDTGGSQVTAQDSTPNATKDYADTRAQFVANILDLFHAGNQDELNRRRAGVVMRAQLNSAGKQARNDGLIEGGVTSGLSQDDLNAHTVWLAQQSVFVTNALDSLYQSGWTDAQVAQHAEMWANVSLQKARYEGIESADKNGIYEFYGDDGLESCSTCQHMKGKSMRMSEWTKKKLRPGVDVESYDCKGFNCQHRLRRPKK